jgi:hypothetical protein
MANERRGNPRHPVNIDAVLNYQHHVIICAVRDLSVDGAFIEVSPDELPHSRAPVEIGFTVTSNGEVHHCRVPALVRRVCDNGAGVKFSDVGTEEYLRLVDVVYKA